MVEHTNRAKQLYTGQHTMVKVLMVLIRRGDIARMEPLVVGLTPADIDGALGEFVVKCPQLYGGRQEVFDVPLVSQLLPGSGG